MEIKPFQYRFYSFESSQQIFDVSKIGRWAFAYSNISLAFLKNCERVDFSAFAYSTINFVRGLNIKSIGQFAFLDCRDLIYVRLQNIEQIETMAFAYCISMKRISLKQCKKLGTEAFRFCTKLEAVYFDNRCEIGKLCFANTNPDLIFWVDEKDYSWYRNIECWQPYRDQIKIKEKLCQ